MMIMIHKTEENCQFNSTIVGQFSFHKQNANMADHSVILNLVGRKLANEDLRVLAVWLGELPSELIDMVMPLSFCVPKY